MIDNDLDRRLGELFTAADLDLAPRPDATGVVLARVRRARRRRRSLQVGLPAIAAVLCGLGLNTLGPRVDGAPVEPSGTTSQSFIGKSSGTELVMSGTSVGSLRLGMSKARAEATGLLVTPASAADPSKPKCLRYEGKHGVVRVDIGPQGVSRIGVYPFIRTPQGVGVGDDYAKLRAAYPASVPAVPEAQTRGYWVQVPGATADWYVFELENVGTGHPPATTHSRIITLDLEREGSLCD